MSKYLTSSAMERLKNIVSSPANKLKNLNFRGGNSSSKTEFIKFDDFRRDDQKESDDQQQQHWYNFDELNLKSGVVGEDDDDDRIFLSDSSISAAQAALNVTNAIQGMCLVSLPYTILQGGYIALLSMVVIPCICYYTGDILIECLYEEVEQHQYYHYHQPQQSQLQQKHHTVKIRKRIRNTYADIAGAVWGHNVGRWIVYTAQMIELIMTCILYVLLCGELLQSMLPQLGISLTKWIIIATAPLLMCAFLKSMKHVAWLSFWNFLSHVIINGIVLIYCLTQVQHWKFDVVQLEVDINTLPMSLGIVMFSYTSQMFLPSLEGSMKDRKKFRPMMAWSHFVAAVFKSLFAYFGFVTFGDETQEVITNNISSYALKITINILLVIKALSSYPLPYYAAVELLQNALFVGQPITLLPSCYYSDGLINGLRCWAWLLRAVFVCLISWLAISIPHYAILIALIGSFTANMLSFVWPAYFHLVIKNQLLPWYRKVFDVIIIILGCVFIVLGVYYNSRALYFAYQGIETKPFQTIV
ncbi:hypothetical protein HELRODRAFT_183498 [Helobdella robusta]|uniref:Amino acid transporter transmembrane domain-containing protein n=1 Tax=Helobdella robusta TaxID=6412 RepID=T1FJR7_HELRO|nr:hypothetical protein HELRODRAFT_183498 [Helobdella robusta]ESO11116.1 hypothetical protein HELRODRAFT_183498 [Helobdella robusta]